MLSADTVPQCSARRRYPKTSSRCGLGTTVLSLIVTPQNSVKTNSTGVSGARRQSWAFQLFHCFHNKVVSIGAAMLRELNECKGLKWSGRVDLNHRPPGPEL